MARRVKKTKRDEYFHRVQMTDQMTRALEAAVNGQTGERWEIHMTPLFWFRIVDKTDPAANKDYGWFESYDEVVEKFGRLFPNIDLGLLTKQ